MNFFLLLCSLLNASIVFGQDIISNSLVDSSIEPNDKAIETDDAIHMTFGDVRTFDINNRIIIQLKRYGPVADIEYDIQSDNVENLKIKLWVQVNIKRNDPKKFLLTVVRLDNIDERHNERMDFSHNPEKKDFVWREWRGWPSDLLINIHGFRNIYLPSNPSKDSMQLELEGNDFKPIVDYNESLSSVPKIIHQIGSDVKGEPAMKVVEKAMLLTKLKNPSYEHHLISIDEMPEYIKSLEGERVRKAFDTLKPMAYKADLFRYVALYHHGGYYMDSKLVPMEPLSKLSSNGKIIIVKDRFENLIQIALLGMQKKDPLIRAAIDKLVDNVEKRFYGKSSLEITGPKLFGNVLDDFIKNDEKKKEHYRPTLIFSKDGFFVNSIENESKKIIYHNGEYRRIQSFNSLPRYADMWRTRIVYGEIIKSDLKKGVVVRRRKGNENKDNFEEEERQEIYERKGRIIKIVE